MSPSSSGLFDRIDRASPVWLEGTPAWEREDGDWTLRFLGRGKVGRPADGLGSLQPPDVELAWLEQRHTDRVVRAAPGSCGEADALGIDEAAVAAAVVTADCLPVAVLAGSRAVLVHAGWRGLAAGLVARAARRLAGEEGLRAWIGPAIGPCCYEVGDDVAEAVSRASGGGVVVGSAGAKPFIDLRKAAAMQLRAAGVGHVALLDHCTRCRPEWLCSHRRDAPRTGRNVTLLWRSAG